MAQQKPIIVLFRHDLRVVDHPALTAAAESGAPVIPLYVLDEAAPGRWAPGGATRWWLHHSLDALSTSLADLGAPLILRRGATREVVGELVGQTDAAAVFASRTCIPWAAPLERDLQGDLASAGCTMKRFAGTLLHDPDKLQTKAGEPYKVFTPFWRILRDCGVRQPVPAPDTLRGAEMKLATDRLDAWRLLPRKPDWSTGLQETWTPGEAAAQSRLEAFMKEGVETYAQHRDRPDLVGTSRLSPHLAFGEISPATCWHAAAARGAMADEVAQGGEVFCKELAWREFSAHLLHHWPDLPDVPFRKAFAEFPWEGSDEAVEAWQQGRTGYPIVDAGMRELWHTGWMHNRVRMVVASFLTKHLLVPWQQGEAWFWDCLVDADLANNAASWQWVAGCGADAAPYFRIFNPITQGRKFDPEGDYVRRWVPEIAALPNDVIHAPWEASPEVLAEADVKLGENYPGPMVDHRTAREAALAAYEHVKSG